MADPMPQPGSRDEVLAAILAEHDRRLREMEAPGGTQRAQVMRSLADQVAELFARSTHTVQPADVSASGNATVEPFPQGTRVFTFPPPQGGRRSAQLVFSWRLTNSDSSAAAQAQAFCALTYASQVVWRDNRGVPLALSAPAGWDTTMSGQIALVVPADTTPVVALTVYRVGFTSTASAVAAAGITATLLYGDRV